MKIRINDKSGNNIAECELTHHDTGIWYVQHKANILNVFNNLELLNEETEEYNEVIDIDIDNLYSPKKINCIKALASAWTVFETLRNEYNLDTHSDHRYVVDILYKPLLYGLITEDEYKSYLNALDTYLGADDERYYFDNSEYTYKELDEFIYNLNPIYKRW